MKIYTDPRLLAAGIVGGTLSRHNGNMCDTDAQTPVYKELDIPPQHILHLHQTHSTHILTINTPLQAQQIADTPVQDADGWLFTLSGWGGAILTADCVPLFLWDSNGGPFSLTHCGWRGVAAKLPFQAAVALKKAGAETICAWLGPHIQSCCFEVQADVAEQFPSSCHRPKNGKIFIDLTAEIIRQLTQAGISETDIKAPYYCTCGDKENFFSWRRDHIRQNLLSFMYKL